MKKGTGWKLGTIALAGTMTVVTATLAGVGGVALNIAGDVLPSKPKNLALEEKINYVALGDGLTSGANMLVGDDYVSFADFFAADMKNANRLGSYENFADSSNKIFDVLNGALMNGAQREAIKNADLITITAGTNDLLAMMELFGVPLADLSTKEEIDRGGLNDVTSLDKQYANRQDKMVEILSQLGTHVASKDFTGAISIDENVFKDLFLAVNLNLTLLTTEIAKIAPGAKIVLLSPFNPVENLPTSLTDAPLGNGGMSFNELFEKLISTYDTVAKLNPATTHINMGEITEYKNDHKMVDVYTEPSANSYTLTKEEKRFNDIDMSPSTYGHELIGNGLFNILSDEMGISKNDTLLSHSRVADDDTDKEIMNGSKFEPELYDESLNGKLPGVKATFALAEQILEPLDTLKYGSKVDDTFVVETLTSSSGATSGALSSKDDKFNWMDDASFKNMLKAQMVYDSALAELMANLQIVFAANSLSENQLLNDTLKGQLKLSSDRMVIADAVFNRMTEKDYDGKKELNGTDTSIEAGSKDIVISIKKYDENDNILPPLIFTFEAGSSINIKEVFGVDNVAQLYGMTRLSKKIGAISSTWEQYFLNNFNWASISKTVFGRSTGTPLIPASQLFNFTSPFYIIVSDGIDAFLDRFEELGVISKDDTTNINRIALKQELETLFNGTQDTNAFQKKLVSDIFGFTSYSDVSEHDPRNYEPNPDPVYDSEMLDPTTPEYAENQNCSPKWWSDKIEAYVANQHSTYIETAKLVNALSIGSQTIKDVMF